VLSSNFISAGASNSNLFRALALLRHRAAAYLLVSLLVLIPCFWQSRVQAGDLGSHLYNAWLAGLIEKGQAPGLVITAQNTNVLFDLLLSALLQSAGAEAAQRIAVSLAVLVFFWGAFAFCAAGERRAPWSIAPALAMLAYGWVFHIGFFNFYLSVGLCFWALAQVGSGRRRGGLLAIPLLAMAYLAHALPVVWAIGVWAYAWLWRGLSRRSRAYLMGACLAVLVLLRAAIVVSMRSRWYNYQIWHVTGADQLWVFGNRYKLLACGLVGLWLWMALDRPSQDRKRAEANYGTALLAVAGLTAAGNFLIPNAIWLPHYQHQLAYITERMSLPTAVLLCAFLARTPLRPWQWRALSLLALLFFGFLYADEATLNRFEDQVDHLVAQLPPGQRVVLSVLMPDSQVNAVDHMVDRACIGRCWSYANYEPSSAQFRIRVAGPTSFIAPTEAESGSLEYGSYVIKPGEPSLVQIQTDPAGRLRMRTPPPWKPIGVTPWDGL
jgi:hypothetical protein